MSGRAFRSHFLFNLGVDLEVTPEWKTVVNFSAMRFHHTEPLEQFVS